MTTLRRDCLPISPRSLAEAPRISKLETILGPATVCGRCPMALPRLNDLVFDAGFLPGRRRRLLSGGERVAAEAD